MPIITPLDPDFVLALDRQPVAISQALEAEVGRIWQAALSAGKRFFDGPMYVLSSADAARLTVRQISFRHHYAAVTEPGLREQGLNLETIGVTGLLFCPDGLVLGQRAEHLARDQGKWETAPAGVLDSLDATACLLKELSEELAIEPHEVVERRPCALIFEPADRAYDIVQILRVELGLREIKRRLARLDEPEYQALRAVPVGALSRGPDPGIRHVENLPQLLSLAASANGGSAQ